MSKQDAFDVPENTEGFMDCHVRGSEPEGYDGADSICHGCADKFTCLPEAIAKPVVWSDRGGAMWSLDDDVEVGGVLGKTMTYSDAIDRMTRRQEIEKGGGVIPAELLVRRPKEEPAAEEPEIIDAPVVVDEPTETEAPPETESDTPVASKASKTTKKKPAKKKAATKKAPAKKAATKKAPAKKKTPAKKAAAKKTPKKKTPARKTKARTSSKPSKPPPKPKPTGPKSDGQASTREPRIARNGKKLPLPNELPQEDMVKAMASVKLGMEVDLELGMQIVRRTRSGKEHIVTLHAQGFMYEDELYSSLSAAAQNASGTPCRSGNDWFNLANTSCTEVRGIDGKVVARKGMDL